MFMVYYPKIFLVLLLVGWFVGEEITIPYFINGCLVNNERDYRLGCI